MRNGLKVRFLIVIVFALTLTACGGGGAPSQPVSPEPETTGSITCKIFATREGLLGNTTANGHVIQSTDRFVALPSTSVLASDGGHEYQVRITHLKTSVVVPIWDVGPWNTNDNYWDTPDQRERWQDLPQCRPEAQAAYENKYNDGKDEFGRQVTNPAGIDLSDGTWAQLRMKDNDWVTVEFLWTAGVQAKAALTPTRVLPTSNPTVTAKPPPPSERLTLNPAEFVTQIFDPGLTDLQRNTRWESYRGKVVTWTGQVENVQPQGDQVNVTFRVLSRLLAEDLRNKVGDVQVTTHYSKKDAAKLSELNMGELYSFEGTLAAYRPAGVEIRGSQLPVRVLTKNWERIEDYTYNAYGGDPVLILHDGLVLVGASGNGTIVAHSADTGKETWRATPPAHWRASQFFAFDGGNAYFFDHLDDRSFYLTGYEFRAVDLATGVNKSLLFDPGSFFAQVGSVSFWRFFTNQFGEIAKDPAFTPLFGPGFGEYPRVGPAVWTKYQPSGRVAWSSGHVALTASLGTPGLLVFSEGANVLPSWSWYIGTGKNQTVYAIAADGNRLYLVGPDTTKDGFSRPRVFIAAYTKSAFP